MNIKIPVARYIDEGVEKEIKATEITSREIYRSKYRGKLYCKEKDCMARLNHVDLRDYGGIMFFRTNAGNNPHKDGCPSEVLYNGTTTYTTSNGEAVEISDEHIKGTIDRRIKEHKKLNNSNESNTVLRRTSNNRKDLPSKPNREKKKGIPSLNGQGKINNENEKGTNIYSKISNQIIEKDFGKPKCIDGYMKEVLLYDDYAQIQFEDKCEFDVFIEFGESYKENNISAFNGLKTIKKYVKDMSERKEAVYCVCVGLVQKRQDKVIIEVYKEVEFRIGELTITQFLLMN